VNDVDCALLRVRRSKVSAQRLKLGAVPSRAHLHGVGSWHVLASRRRAYRAACSNRVRNGVAERERDLTEGRRALSMDRPPSRTKGIFTPRSSLAALCLEKQIWRMSLNLTSPLSSSQNWSRSSGGTAAQHGDEGRCAAWCVPFHPARTSPHPERAFRLIAGLLISPSYKP